MPLQPEERERVKRFHQGVTLAGGLLLVGGALAASYMAFFRPSREFPSWLISVARFFSGR